MNIPFDQIYNHLAGYVDDDIIIYRFVPPGSKKLADLRQLLADKRDYVRAHDSVIMIMNDQEPLMPHAVTQEDLRIWFQKNIPPLEFYIDNVDLVAHLLQRDLASVCDTTVIADRNILCHSELNSPAVTYYQQLGFETVYWWSHAVIARDWYRYAEWDTRLARKRPWTHDFLIYNRAWSGTREYRLMFTDQILSHDLSASCRITFNAWDTGKHYREHEFVNSQFRIMNDLECLPSSMAPSTASADYSVDDYAACWWDIVTETLFDDPRVYLTEKVLRPIACGRPFMLLAPAGSLAYLRQQGFETFDDIIDETYDSITNPVDRMQAVIGEMRRLQALSLQQKHDLQQRIQSRLAYNKSLFFSAIFIQRQFEEWQSNFRQARQNLQGQRQGRNWIACRKLLAKNDLHRGIITKYNPRVDVSSIMEVLKRCALRRCLVQ